MIKNDATHIIRPSSLFPNKGAVDIWGGESPLLGRSAAYTAGRKTSLEAELRIPGAALSQRHPQSSPHHMSVAKSPTVRREKTVQALLRASSVLRTLIRLI